MSISGWSVDSVLRVTFVSFNGWLLLAVGVIKASVSCIFFHFFPWCDFLRVFIFILKLYLFVRQSNRERENQEKREKQKEIQRDRD